MKINRLDEFFRSKLKTYKAEVPPHIWAQIKTELTENGTSSYRTAFPRVYILAASLVAVIAVAVVPSLFHVMFFFTLSSPINDSTCSLFFLPPFKHRGSFKNGATKKENCKGNGTMTAKLLRF